MPSSNSILLCLSCGWKKVCDPDASGLLELKNDSMSSRKFRCPGCGRAIAPRSHQDPQSEMNRRASDERIKAENEVFINEVMDFQKNFIRESEDGDK